MRVPSKRSATIKSLKAEFASIYAKGHESTLVEVARGFAIRGELARLGVSTVDAVQWIKEEKA
jgi:hypothetical protein